MCGVAFRGQGNVGQGNRRILLPPIFLPASSSFSSHAPRPPPTDHRPHTSPAHPIYYAHPVAPITDHSMLTWVVYDISKDRTRGKIADRCLDFGLQRVQKSVYQGDLEPNRVDEVIEFSRELLDLETDSVFVFPMCREDFDKVRIVGQCFDRELVADEVATKVIWNRQQNRSALGSEEQHTWSILFLPTLARIALLGYP